VIAPFKTVTTIVFTFSLALLSDGRSGIKKNLYPST
jgi:hypothetical protein